MADWDAMFGSVIPILMALFFPQEWEGTRGMIYPVAEVDPIIIHDTGGMKNAHGRGNGLSTWGGNINVPTVAFSPPLMDDNKQSATSYKY